MRACARFLPQKVECPIFPTRQLSAPGAASTEGQHPDTNHPGLSFPLFEVLLKKSVSIGRVAALRNIPHLPVANVGDRAQVDDVLLSSLSKHNRSNINNLGYILAIN
jgi:hypothetical protein